MLIEKFSQIEDLEGRPIVAKIERVNDMVAATDRFRRYLPDFLLNWNPVKTNETAGLRLNGHEIARWPSGQPFDSGRSGNHATEGWFAAIGRVFRRNDQSYMTSMALSLRSIGGWGCNDLHAS